jgi:O-antigen chain-terminating methyltransferase
MPLLHARDTAEAKVAAIGSVNPRPPGLKNSLIQSFKRVIARALDWHIREQVEFNRAAMACVQASLEALTDAGRSLAALAAYHRQLREELEARDKQVHEEVIAREGQLREDLRGLQRDGAGLASQMEDIRRHWAEWRPGFEERRSASEIHILRTISELQAAFQHRVTLLEQNYREMARHQHSDFAAALERNTLEVQGRLWKDLERIRGEYEKLIYTELRVLRQKQEIAPRRGAAEGAPAISQSAVPLDWMRFAEVFRGSEAAIRERQQRHVARFAGTEGEILDLGCGRGEFLEAAHVAGLAARGIDLSEECVALCHSKGLEAERGDIFDYLTGSPSRSIRGVFCSQVVEHIPPERVPALVQLLGEKLHAGAVAVIETPNPECLAIFASHFYIDPTHTRPVPPALMHFYLEEAGFGNIEVERLEPALNSMPAVLDLPTSVRDTFFDGLDYAIIARKL